MLLDLVWLLRQGDPFGSGVAAAALAQVRCAAGAAGERACSAARSPEGRGAAAVSSWVCWLGHVPCVQVPALETAAYPSLPCWRRVQYNRPGQVPFLAAVAAMPAVALLWSPHSYGQHSAARLLSTLARASPAMPDVLVEAGAVRGLLQQLDLR